MREGGGNCLKYLKRRWNRKEGRRNKDFKKGGKVGQEVGALKREWAGTPLRTVVNSNGTGIFKNKLVVHDQFIIFAIALLISIYQKW